MEILMRDDQYQTLLSKYKPHMLETSNKRARFQPDTTPTQDRDEAKGKYSNMKFIDNISEPEEGAIEIVDDNEIRT